MAQEDAKFVAAVDAAINGAPVPGTITRENMQEAAELTLNQLPPAQTPVDLEREVELRLYEQLHFISLCPPDSMTVNEFADYTKQSETGRRVLEQYMDQGWVSRTFRDHYGRYSLTPAGLDHLVELARKYDLPQ